MKHLANPLLALLLLIPVQTAFSAEENTSKADQKKADSVAPQMAAIIKSDLPVSQDVDFTYLNNKVSTVAGAVFTKGTSAFNYLRDAIYDNLYPNLKSDAEAIVSTINLTAKDGNLGDAVKGKIYAELTAMITDLGQRLANDAKYKTLLEYRATTLAYTRLLVKAGVKKDDQLFETLYLKISNRNPEPEISAETVVSKITNKIKSDMQYPSYTYTDLNNKVSEEAEAVYTKETSAFYYLRDDIYDNLYPNLKKDAETIVSKIDLTAKAKDLSNAVDVPPEPLSYNKVLKERATILAYTKLWAKAGVETGSQAYEKLFVTTFNHKPPFAISTNTQTTTTSSLSAFAVNYANSVSVASVNIFNGFTNLTENTKLGLLISGASAIGTPELADYVSSELLSRDGALLNVSLSLISESQGRFLLNPNTWANRRYAIDRTYFLSLGNFMNGIKRFFPIVNLFSNKKADALTDDDIQKINNRALLYCTMNFLGAKLVKTALQSASESTTSSDNSSNLMFAGVSYLGIGFDGPLYKSGEKLKADAKAEGGFDIETHIAAELANKKTLGAIFNVTNAETKTFYWGVRFKAYYTDNFSIAVSYDKPITNTFIKPVLRFSIGYNK